MALAREYHVLPVAIVLDLPERVCHERNRSRPDRDFGPHVIRNQKSQLHRSLRGLGREGFRHVHVLKIAGGSRCGRHRAAAALEQPQAGPRTVRHHRRRARLLRRARRAAPAARYDAGTASASWAHPSGRKAIFVGDLVDRGPRIVDTLQDRDGDVAGGIGAVRAWESRHQVEAEARRPRRHGQRTASIARWRSWICESPEFRTEVQKFLDGLVSHYVFDDGQLVVAHAGMKAGDAGSRVGQGAGLRPVRRDNRRDRRVRPAGSLQLGGRVSRPCQRRLRTHARAGAGVAQPHDQHRHRLRVRRPADGPALAREGAGVGARAVDTYADPVRPFLPTAAAPALSAQQANDDLLDIDDVRGKRLDHDPAAPDRHDPRGERRGGAGGDEPVRGESEVADLPAADDVAERDDARADGLLEHPAEAFSYYRANGVPTVVVEQKHMGSRAILIVCRSKDVARERFGILEDEDGICYTRTGRRFFEDAALERELLATVRGALERSGFWEQFKTNWVCLDCELMPWSAKALELVRQQYASVGTAARVGLGEAVGALERAAARGIDVGALLERHKVRQDLAERFAQAYRHYCWPVESLRDIRIAPFHVMATEGAVHADKDHVWHMTTISSFVDPDGASADGHAVSRSSTWPIPRARRRQRRGGPR